MTSIAQVGESIARLLGDTKNYGVDAVRRIKSTLNLVEHESIVPFLPYQSFDSTNNLFVNQDSIGFGIELLPLSGIDEESIERITSMINDKLPENGDLHIQVFANNKIGAFVDRFLKEREKGSDINKRAARARAEYYKKRATTSITPHYPFFIRDFRVYMYYAEPTKSYGELQIQEICRMREAWKSTLSNITAIEDINAERLIAVTKEILSPSQSPYWPTVSYRKLDSINNQVTSFDTAYDIKPEYVDVDGGDNQYKIQTLSAEELPERAALWQMGENLGRVFEVGQQMTCPFTINIHLRALNKAASQSKAQQEFMMNDKKAHSPLARLVPSIRKKHEEWTYLREHLTGNERLCRAYFSITMYSKNDTAIRDLSHAKDLFQSNGFRVMPDKYLQWAGFLSNLPFLMTTGLFDDLNYFDRFRTMTTFNAVNLMPIMGDWKGNPKSTGQIFITPRGQIFNFLAHDNPDGNLSTVVGATSRSGKTVITQDKVANILDRGGIVVILDVGGSYKELTRQRGGVSIEVNETLCINPFSNIKDFSESSGQVEKIISIMAHPNGDASDIEKSLITNAVAKVFAEKGCKATVSAVMEELKKGKKQEAKDLALLLGKFCAGGKYASYFEGKATVDLNNPLIEIDFEPVKDKEDLKAVLVMSIILHINEVFFNEDPIIRARPKLCVIDEAWNLLHHSKDAAVFIGAGYRRIAKYNGAFLTIMQSVNDFFKDEVCQTIYELSDHQLILRHKPEALDSILKESRLKLTPYEERLLRSIKGSDQYKECLIRTPQGSSLVRVVLDPFTRILYSSKAEHVSQIKHLKERGMSAYDAVMTVAKQEYADEM